jgi:hypothetical protein
MGGEGWESFYQGGKFYSEGGSETPGLTAFIF